MGVLDKIKNALFEVEYVEVEEPPKKEKKTRLKEREKEDKEKPIAKKIVLPGKREEKVEELQEEELRDEDFEIRPKDEVVKETRDSFKFMDDNDFKMDDDIISEEPKLVNGVSNEPPEAYTLPEKEVVPEVSQPVVDNRNLYPPKESKPYGMDRSYSVPVHEYGAYEKREEKTYFKPSPIISPIYGILDKNYRKEDVKEKKEIRLTSFSRSNVSVDEVRNKAYGKEKEEEEKEKVEESKFEVEEENNNDDNLLVDLSDRSAKPEVKEITMGDALEYFQDLGLEYNVDYVDASKEKAKGRRLKENYDEEDTEDNNSDKVKPVEEVKVENVVVKDESADKKEVEDDSDNLFDLIDSMYQDSE